MKKILLLLSLLFILLAPLAGLAQLCTQDNTACFPVPKPTPSPLPECGGLVKSPCITGGGDPPPPVTIGDIGDTPFAFAARCSNIVPADCTGNPATDNGPSGCNVLNSQNPCLGGGGVSLWARNQFDGGDGLSLDISYQPELIKQGLLVFQIDPGSYLPLDQLDLLDQGAYNAAGLATPECQQCVQDQEDKCTAEFDLKEVEVLGGMALATAPCVAGAITALIPGGQVATMALVGKCALGIGADAAFYLAARKNRYRYDVCNTNVKWACAAFCKKP
jgi:hypothetical protein